jgi:hypothetical protein
MQRRDFLQTSLQTTAVASAAAACGLATAATTQAAEPVGDVRQLYEWRIYQLADKAKQARLSDYLESAAVPAWKRFGLGPVGVFTEIGAEATGSIHVLLNYSTVDAVAIAREQLEADAEYKKAAADYLAAKKEDPAFDRIESTLLVAFAGHAKITPPKHEPRVLELRTYENHGEDRARAKVEMFNDGEIQIFPKCGFENVFFGESLIGPDLPNLKYMLAASSMEANAAGWKTFISHPDFVRMRDDPKYANTEPKITKLYLAPTDYSQI